MHCLFHLYLGQKFHPFFLVKIRINGWYSKGEIYDKFSVMDWGRWDDWSVQGTASILLAVFPSGLGFGKKEHNLKRNA